MACAGVDCYFEPLIATMSFPDLSSVIPVVIGFFSGWATSELTEAGKRRRARRSLRQALLVELERTEVRMNTTVMKYAYLAKTVQQVTRVASEGRWFVRVGIHRAPGANVVVPDGFEGNAERFCALPERGVGRAVRGTDAGNGRQCVSLSRVGLGCRGVFKDSQSSRSRH
jgi:hypothetical protein